MATCNVETLMQDAATSGFSKLAERNKLDVLLQLMCDISSSSATWGGGSFVVAVTDEVLALSTGTEKVAFRMPYAMSLTDIRASVNTAPIDLDLQVDVNIDTGSIFNTVLTIDDGDTTSVGSASPYEFKSDPFSLDDNAEIIIDIDQVGSTNAGSGLKLTFIGTKV